MSYESYQIMIRNDRFWAFRGHWRSKFSHVVATSNKKNIFLYMNDIRTVSCVPYNKRTPYYMGHTLKFIWSMYHQSPGCDVREIGHLHQIRCRRERQIDRVYRKLGFCIKNKHMDQYMNSQSIPFEQKYSDLVGPWPSQNHSSLIRRPKNPFLKLLVCVEGRWTS